MLSGYADRNIHRDELIRILESVRDTSAAIEGQDDCPAVARLLRHRADLFRRIAREHPDEAEVPAGLAAGSAVLDDKRAARIEARQGSRRDLETA